MDTQSIVAAFIVASAVIYVASVFLKKTKGFSKKSGCATDCGCESKAGKPKTVATGGTARESSVIRDRGREQFRSRPVAERREQGK